MTPLQSLATLDFAFGDSSTSELGSEPIGLPTPIQSIEADNLDALYGFDFR